MTFIDLNPANPSGDPGNIQSKLIGQIGNQFSLVKNLIDGFTVPAQKQVEADKVVLTKLKLRILLESFAEDILETLLITIDGDHVCPHCERVVLGFYEEDGVIDKLIHKALKGLENGK